MRLYTIQGASDALLFVMEEGNPFGKPIVFIHGVSQNKLCWIRQLDSDLLRDYRLIVLDLRGHGLSDKPLIGYDDEKIWAYDIHSIITYLKLDKPFLVGWDYGGKVILDYINIYGEENISGINLIDVGTSSSIYGGRYYTSTSQEILSGLMSSDTLICNNSLQEFVRMLFYHSPSEKNFYFFLGFTTIVPPYVREAIIKRKVFYDNLLAKINVPVLLTHGIEDEILYPSQSIDNSKIIKNSKLSLYENTGHSPFWEKPIKFNKELVSFINECYNNKYHS
ncbi:alpha/beta fold hydrolase [Clostridium sp. 'White wine YQ']|uniref:alpha/beta fold hydrolase n=1 Tax=Clostridium sp. 'White wine YQ' TaxID=3027474 RepID=UPI00236669EB|nr:alpha/beta hydrolase [Clostridium sp. 'White wine YQ']MDD7793385.1 alpha/beta hydrolase [Clostridium sp. 'White wine YQ']